MNTKAFARKLKKQLKKSQDPAGTLGHFIPQVVGAFRKQGLTIKEDEAICLPILNLYRNTKDPMVQIQCLKFWGALRSHYSVELLELFGNRRALNGDVQQTLVNVMTSF